MRRTTLLVPVPEAEAATSPWWPQWVPPKARGIPAHVTVLFPFVPARAVDDDVLERLREAVATVPAFRASFGRVGRFPQTVYLVPRPAAPFRALVERVADRFPDVLPYGGAHRRIVPHLTVLTTADETLLERAAREVEPALPLRAEVREVALMLEREHGGWEQRASFPLGPPRPTRGGGVRR